MESVKDKVVLITGASSGIGAATAIEFAKYGCRLVLTGRNVDNLNKTAEQCQTQGLDKGKVLTVVGDVTVDGDLTRIVDTAISTFNTIHILINNAALWSFADLQSQSVNVLDKIYRVSLRGAVLLTKLVIPHLKKNGGSVVNVSSLASLKADPKSSEYGMMKAALDMFTKDLALECAKDGVRVNSINPGVVRTQIFAKDQHLQGEALEKFFLACSEINPLGRIGRAEEIARSIVFLASDASSFTTGAILSVDGGLSLTAAWTPRVSLTGTQPEPVHPTLRL